MPQADSARARIDSVSPKVVYWRADSLMSIEAIRLMNRLFVTAAKDEEDPGVTFRTPSRSRLRIPWERTTLQGKILRVG